MAALSENVDVVQLFEKGNYGSMSKKFLKWFSDIIMIDGSIGIVF